MPCSVFSFGDCLSKIEEPAGVSLRRKHTVTRVNQGSFSTEAKRVPPSSITPCAELLLPGHSSPNYTGPYCHVVYCILDRLITPCAELLLPGSSPNHTGLYCHVVYCILDRLITPCGELLLRVLPRLITLACTVMLSTVFLTV